MINRVGDSGPGAARPLRVDTGHSAAAPGSAGRQAAAQAGSARTLVDEIVARGAPVDSAKVTAIKAAIAEGRYPVDAIRIAEGMMALGFGPKE